MKEFQNTPLWNAKNNKKMWRMLTEGKNTEDASPLCSKLPNNIPVTYIEVAEIDCLRDEGLMYAERLRKAGADVSVTVVAGAMHGYDFARGTQTVAALRKKRLAFLSGFRESYKRL